MQAFSPREIVSELDRFIIGQDDAKKAVAIALRNRWRRQQLEGEIKEEILPKNILMVGPTIRIFFGSISSFISPSSCWRRHLFLRAIATAFLASS